MSLIDQLAMLTVSLAPIPLFFWWVKVDAERALMREKVEDRT